MTGPSQLSPPDPDLAFFLPLEHRVRVTLSMRNAAVDAEPLDAAFVGIYPDGIASRADHAAQVSSGPSVKRYALDGACLLRLSPDAVLLSYDASYPPSGDVDKVPARAMFVSSIPARRDPCWVNDFSRDPPARAAAG